MDTTDLAFTTWTTVGLTYRSHKNGTLTCWAVAEESLHANSARTHISVWPVSELLKWSKSMDGPLKERRLENTDTFAVSHVHGFIAPLQFWGTVRFSSSWSRWQCEYIVSHEGLLDSYFKHSWTFWPQRRTCHVSFRWWWMLYKIYSVLWL